MKSVLKVTLLTIILFACSESENNNVLNSEVINSIEFQNYERSLLELENYTLDNNLRTKVNESSRAMKSEDEIKNKTVLLESVIHDYEENIESNDVLVRKLDSLYSKEFDVNNYFSRLDKILDQVDEQGKILVNKFPNLKNNSVELSEYIYNKNLEK